MSERKPVAADVPAVPPRRANGRRLARRAITAATLLYCWTIVLLAALWTLAPRLTWPVEVTNLFAALFFAPLALLIPLALLVRSRWMLLGVGLPLALFVALFGDRFTPRRPPAATAPQLRVVTLNVWRSNEDIERTARAIQAQRPDVVALQEISSSMFAALADTLRQEYPYEAVYNGDHLGILSRYPITSSGSLRSMRGHWITLSPGETTIAVVNVHVHRDRLETGRIEGIDWLPVLRGYDSRAQQQQIQSLLEELERARLPYVLAGDFNLGDRDPAYAMLAGRLTDAYRAAERGFGFTYPNQRRAGPLELAPVLRIDYIWSVAGVLPRAARVDCATGSDHCMLVAELLIAV